VAWGSGKEEGNGSGERKTGVDEEDDVGEGVEDAATNREKREGRVGEPKGVEE